MLAKLIVKIWLFILLTIIVIISQIIILKPHLQYGFSDVDWGFLSFYKTQNPYTIHQFIKNIEIGGTLGGVYTHQIYYIGIQHDFFGLDFKSFQITTHIFKILATLAVFPLLLAISGSRLVAFISTILFAFSYSTVGTMYTVVTSSDYFAIFSMGIFILLYWYVVKKNIGNWAILLLLLLLLMLTLFLSTERMYQLPLFIALTEGFLVWQRQKLGKNMIKRLLIMFLPLILIFLAKPMVFLSYFLSHGIEIVQRISAGNWNLLLTPFAALGSIITPGIFTKFLGNVNLESWSDFLGFFMSGPLLILTLTTVILGIALFKSFLPFTLQTLLLTFILSIFLYVSASHHVDHLISQGAVLHALIGVYILSVSLVTFRIWLKNKNPLLMGIFVGPIFALLYIFLTWLGAATSEVFTGTHRYLTIPALLMSLFLGTIFAVIFKRINNLSKKIPIFRSMILIPTLFFLFFLNVNFQETRAFFNSQLANGFGAADKNLMRNQLNDNTGKLSSESPSLFYFDFMEDNDRGYYYDNTLLGGFGTWMLWHPSINFNKDLAPKAFWNNPELLKVSMQIKNGEKVIVYEKKVYNINNFYAFKLKDKKLIDIKEQTLSGLGI